MNAWIPLTLAMLACGTPSEQPAEAEEPATAQAVAAHVEDKGEGAIEAQPGHYGAGFTLTESTPVQALLDEPAPHVGKNVRVSGEITTVCQKAGCWMVLRADGGDTLRVTMKDHSFSVPKDSAGSTAHVEGTVLEQDVDPEQVAHFESETTEGGDVPEKGRDKVYAIDASAVEII